jgi:hypothetical protein
MFEVRHKKGSIKLSEGEKPKVASIIKDKGNYCATVAGVITYWSWQPVTPDSGVLTRSISAIPVMLMKNLLQTFALILKLP